MDPILINIHKELSQQGKTQKDLCDYLGVTAGNFSQWNSGKNRSYKKKLPLIAEFFGVDEQYLISGRASPAERLYGAYLRASEDTKVGVAKILGVYPLEELSAE